MEQIRLTTTKNIAIEDLGDIKMNHPTNDYILYDRSLIGNNPFRLEELRDSTDLQNLLDDGSIILTDELGNNIQNIYLAASDNLITSVNGKVGDVTIKTDDIDDSNQSNKFTNQNNLDKLSGIEENATQDMTDLEIKQAYERNLDTNAFSNDEKDKLENIESESQKNVLSDWNATIGDGRILNKPSDITDLSIHSVEELNDVTDSGSGKIIKAIERQKLSGIEENATKDMTDSEIKQAYERNPNTNAFTTDEKNKLNILDPNAQQNVKSDWNSNTGDSQILNKPSDVTDLSIHSVEELSDITDSGSGEIIKISERQKLSGIEENATQDMTDLEIKQAYERNANTNTFSDLYKNKLENIEANAQQNVNPDWNSNIGDSQILNKPSDITDLDKHSVEELNDITSKGSGQIISNTERSQLHEVNKDTILDQGGINEISAKDIKDHTNDNSKHLNKDLSDALTGTGNTPNINNKFVTEDDQRHKELFDFIELFNNKESVLELLKSFSIGSHNNEQSLIVGNGCSTSDLLIYSQTNTNTYIDLSNSNTDPTKNINIPNNTTNNCIYIASNRLNTDNKSEMFTTLNIELEAYSNLGFGQLVWEYWNGQWTRVNTMLIDKNNNNIQSSNNLFNDSNMSKDLYCYFNNDILSDWLDTSDNGNLPLKKWIRLRVESNVITTPIFKTIKVIPDIVEHINGMQQYFGNYRGGDYLPFFWNAAGDLSGFSGLHSDDTYVSNNFGHAGQNNRWANSRRTNGSIWTKLPQNIDTSTPIILNLVWYSTSNGGNNQTLDFEISWINRKELDKQYDGQSGAPTNNSNIRTVNLNIDMSGKINQTLYETNVKLDISNYSPRNIDNLSEDLLINIIRPRNDYHNGSITILNVTAFYTKWCDNPKILLKNTIN